MNALIILDTILLTLLALIAIGLHVRLNVLRDAQDRSDEIDDENNARTVRNFLVTAEALDDHAAELRTHEANIKSLIDIGNHITGLTSLSQQHELDIQDLIKVQFDTDSKVMDLRTEVRAHTALATMAHENIAEQLIAQHEVNKKLITDNLNLQARVSELQANLVLAGVIEPWVGSPIDNGELAGDPNEVQPSRPVTEEEMEFIREQFAESGLVLPEYIDGRNYAKEYEGKFDINLPPLDVKALTPCDAGRQYKQEFMDSCRSCMQQAGFHDTDTWLIMDSSIKDFNLWRRWGEDTDSHKRRVAEVIARQRPNTLQLNEPAYNIKIGDEVPGSGGMKITAVGIVPLLSESPQERFERMAADVMNRAFSSNLQPGPACSDDVEGGPFRG